MDRLLIYDDRCGFCLSSVSLLRKFDWRRVHRYEGSSKQEVLRQVGITSKEADEELKLWVSGCVYGGYDAVTEALRAMPATFLLARLMGWRPVRWVGRRIYRGIASRRKCTYRPA